LALREGQTVSDYREIYSNHAGEYEQLVAREDYQGNILPALLGIRAYAGLDVVDMGAGTGRLTCLLAPLARSMRAFDASQHMLDVAVAKLRAGGLSNWQAQAADHRRLPLPDAAADVVISGWSIVYLTVEHPETWQEELETAIGEMRRVLRPGGTIIILETLGTGFETPQPPHAMREYLAYLDSHGFASTWIRTDYRFRALAEAESLTRFFFGEEMAQKVVENKWVILPECTGLWWLHTPHDSSIEAGEKVQLHAGSAL
jgi:ubiquinone/menaquinone biosynthesis C-methylase UbiE